jgi:hypothetical protein
MFELALIGLIVAFLLMSGVAFYYYNLSRGGKSAKELQPFNPFLIGVCALTFGLIVVFLFYIFVDVGFEIKNNMGQVGDFIGGLTNPVLSFIALLVLLRSNLIQTEEARKTAEILLKQQQLLEHERFESGFYSMLQKFETLLEKGVRAKKPAEDGSVAKLSLALRKDRDILDALHIRDRYKKVVEIVDESVKTDVEKRFCIGAVRLCNFIDESDQPLSRKKYYMRIMFEILEPHETIYLLSCIFVSFPFVRRKLRKYMLAFSIKRESFVSGFVHDYFCKNYKKRLRS